MKHSHQQHIITIGGKPGSGKSSTAKQLAELLGYQHFSSGDFLREVAHKRGMSIKELIEQAEKDESIDKEIDELLMAKAQDENFVLDSRLAFHWIPHSYKVFLDIQPEQAAARVFHDLKNNPLRQKSEGTSEENLLAHDLRLRHEKDLERYQKYYQVDYANPEHFDLVIDTGNPKHDLPYVVQKIHASYEESLRKNNL